MTKAAEQPRLPSANDDDQLAQEISHCKESSSSMSSLSTPIDNAAHSPMPGLVSDFSMSIEEILKTTLIECTQELFQAFYLRLELDSEGRANGQEKGGWAGAMGFISDQVRGNLAIAPSARAIQRTKPAQRSSDWLAELASQLMDKLVMRLHEFDINLQTNEPVIAPKETLSTLFFKNPRTLRVELSEGGDYGIVVFLDAECDPMMRLRKAS